MKWINTPLADIDAIPTNPRDVEHELRHVRALMQLEQREDQAQFKLKNTSASIKERRRRGFTWYPVTIIKEDIGFGGKVVLEIERPAHRQESVQIITCTLVGASNRNIRHLSFETVFIDEAAQALEPGCWIPIAKGQRIILTGDHHQLPPTVKSEKAAREGLRETLFEKCIMRQPDTARMLTVQYRMHEQIMGFSSEKFYEGQLEAHHTVRHAGLEAYDQGFAPDRPMEFLDTAECDFLEVTIPESRSTANPEEANLLLARLTQLLAAYDPANHEHKQLTIGVIAPYRAQINYLMDAIEENDDLNDLLLHRMLSVGTVDSFQGQERDIIAISLTRSNPYGEIGFLSDIRRMNVGMTRARRKLLLVGDSSTLSHNPFFVELLAHIKRMGGYPP